MNEEIVVSIVLLLYAMDGPPLTQTVPACSARGPSIDLHTELPRRLDLAYAVRDHTAASFRRCCCCCRRRRRGGVSFLLPHPAIFIVRIRPRTMGDF